MRVLHLRRRFYASKRRFAPPGSPEGRAVVLVLRELGDEESVVPGPDDRGVDLPPAVLGRPVPGTNLVICYIPAALEVHVVELVRRP